MTCDVFFLCCRFKHGAILYLCNKYCTWKISSLCDSKECSFSFRFLKSQRATVYGWERSITPASDSLHVGYTAGNPITLSADPVARMNSLYGLNDRQLTSAVWASTTWLGLEVLFERVSQLRRREAGSPILQRRHDQGHKAHRTTSHTVLTSWDSGHLLQSQRATRAASARTRLPPQQCDRWRSSSRRRPSPPLARHWCPIDRWSIPNKKT